MSTTTYLRLPVAVLTVLFFTLTVSAAEINTEHTFKLGKEPSPPASIEDAAWLVGSWRGTAFNSQFEEVWNAPSANSMMGMFKVFTEADGVSFYELMIIVEINGSLELKVKHFSADFKGWEKQDDYVSFPLVSIQNSPHEKNELHFAGLSFYQNGGDNITAYVAQSKKDGTLSEEKLIYSKNK